VLLGQFQELEREGFHARGGLVSLFVRRSLPVRVRGFPEFLEKRSILFRGRDRLIRGRRHPQAEDKNQDSSHDAVLRLDTGSSLQRVAFDHHTSRPQASIWYALRSRHR
jgi:hypothetical protein